MPQDVVIRRYINLISVDELRRNMRHLLFLSPEEILQFWWIAAYDNEEKGEEEKKEGENIGRRRGEKIGEEEEDKK